MYLRLEYDSLIHQLYPLNWSFFPPQFRIDSMLSCR